MHFAARRVSSCSSVKVQNETSYVTGSQTTKSYVEKGPGCAHANKKRVVFDQTLKLNISGIISPNDFKFGECSCLCIFITV